MKRILTTIFSAVILFTAFFCLNASASEDYGIYFTNNETVYNINSDVLSKPDRSLSFIVELEEGDRVINVLIDDVTADYGDSFTVDGDTYLIEHFSNHGYEYEGVDSVTFTVVTEMERRYSAEINLINVAPIVISTIEADGESEVTTTTQIVFSTDTDLSGAITSESFEDPSVYVSSGFNDIEYKITLNNDAFVNEQTLKITFMPGYYIEQDGEELTAIDVTVFKSIADQEQDDNDQDDNDQDDNGQDDNGQGEPGQGDPGQGDPGQGDIEQGDIEQVEPEQNVPEQNEPEQNVPEQIQSNSETETPVNTNSITNNSTPYVPVFNHYYFPFNLYAPQSIFAPFPNDTQIAPAYDSSDEIIQVIEDEDEEYITEDFTETPSENAQNNDEISFAISVLNIILKIFN
jgi:hypothetical protein